MLSKHAIWVLTFTFTFAVTGCAQVKSILSPPLPPEKLRAETLKIVDLLKEKPDWLYASDSCPASVMTEVGNKPNFYKEGCSANPQKCLNDCKNGDPTSCYALALLIEEYVEPYSESPQPLYLRSCKLGITSGCTNRAANIAELKPNDLVAQKCATDTFEKTCSQNDPWGCTMFGLALSRGDGRTKDVPAAVKALEKACEVSVDKNGSACKKSIELRELIKRTESLENKVNN